MPAKLASRLPEQLAAFAAEFAQSGDRRAAAVAIGVHPERAAQFARDALANHLVQEAVTACMRGRFAEAGPIALNVILMFARNEEGRYSGDLQLTAARDLANRAGYRALERAGITEAEKDLSEMTPAELRRVVDATETELARRAKAIVAPVLGTSSAQAVDLEG